MQADVFLVAESGSTAGILEMVLGYSPLSWFPERRERGIM